MKAYTTTERRVGKSLWGQSAVGLLLALLATTSLQAAPPGIIGSDSHTGTNLYVGFPTNTGVVVLSGVTLDNLTSGNDAVYGDTHAWDLTNAGATISGNVNGIYLLAGGSVMNMVDGVIAGGSNGMVISGGPGYVNNSGAITGTNETGVLLLDGGGVVNNSSGFISGGVSIIGGSGFVNNSGAITGTNETGVLLLDGGDVVNNSSGFISGGVSIIGGSGYVNNSGAITGTNKTGVLLLDGGEVVNNSSGFISGGVSIIGGSGFVENADGSTITGQTGAGVQMTAGGFVDNESGGTIIGYQDGVSITGGSGTVDNYTGSCIVGQTGDGVHLTAGGSVDNDSVSTITGGFNGVFITGPGSVNNSGRITGGLYGMNISGGGSVVITNTATGSIYGGNEGIAAEDYNGNITIYNYSSIKGGTATNNAMDLGSGNDTVHLYGLPTIVGCMNGLGGSNVLDFQLAGSLTNVNGAAATKGHDLAAYNLGASGYIQVSGQTYQWVNFNVIGFVAAAPIEAWRYQYFGTTTNGGTAADWADPDNTGIPNLLKYAYGINPTNVSSTACLQTMVVSNTFAVTFPHNTSATDLTLNLQGADSLIGAWTNLATSTVGGAFTAVVTGVTAVETGTNTVRMVTVTDAYSTTDPAHPTRFLRLEVQH
jgi:hypothetical protein